MKIAKHSLWVAAVFATITVGITALFARFGEDKAPMLLKPDDKIIVTEGRQLYNVNCASCHGIDLRGQPNWQNQLPNGRFPAPPHDADGHTWHHAEPLLFEITKYGVQKIAGENYKTDMPAYEGVLTDEEIVAILSYIKSRWPKEIRERHNQMTISAALD